MNIEYCILSFFFGIFYCMILAAAEELYCYLIERKKVKRLLKQSLISCPFCDSYLHIGDRFCPECGKPVKFN